MRSHLLAATAVSAFVLISAPGGLNAQQPPADDTTAAVVPLTVHGSLSLSAGQGQIVHLTGQGVKYFTADPKVVEIQPAGADSMWLFAIAPGKTTVVAMDANGHMLAQYGVTVRPGDYDAQAAHNAAASGATGNVSSTPTDSGVRLSGSVNAPYDAEFSDSAAHSVLPADGKVDNRLRVRQPMQVSLHVRIAEMSRSLTRELGVNWSGVASLGTTAAFGISTNTLNNVSGTAVSQIGGQLGSCGLAYAVATVAGQPASCQSRGYQINSVIDALAQDGLVHVLAEPNLTAMSGEMASFLVGGEYLIPITTAQNTVSLSFKQYGVSLTFVPTVLSNDHIILHVRPEVSALDKANGVPVANFNGTAIVVPALTVRRAETTVDLGSGQSFAIAGLLSDQTSDTIQGLPGISDLPILGPLFRSDAFQRQQTELVIVVTPYLVRPVSDPTVLKLPTDGFRIPNDIERIVYARQLGRTMQNNAVRRIPADVGFVVE